MKSDQMKSHEVSLLQSALGPKIMSLFADSTIVEIMRNPDGNIWVDQHGVGQVLMGPIQSDANAKRTIEIVATATGRVCNREKPILSGEIPGTGHRFQGILPPAADTPAWCIRIKASRVYTLDDYVAAGIMTQAQKEILIEGIKKRKNILVVGATQAGKTTLVNALLDESSKTEQRHILIEDTYELQCNARNKVALHSNDYIQMNDLLAATMRLNPTRIIVGEVKRGMEAYTLLMSMNTGHGGCVSTIHANSAKDGLYRIEELLQENGMIPVPMAIARAIHLVIFIEATPQGRKVQEIAEVKDYNQENGYLLNQI